MDRSKIDTCSLTELRRRPTACIARSRDIGRPLFITRRGTPIAVLIPIEQYEAMHGEVGELAAFVQRAAALTLARVAASEVPPRVAALRGCLKGSTVDESDYRRYLEEKHR